jgi:hypothetical protein
VNAASAGLCGLCLVVGHEAVELPEHEAAHGEHEGDDAKAEQAGIRGEQSALRGQGVSPRWMNADLKPALTTSVAA